MVDNPIIFWQSPVPLVCRSAPIVGANRRFQMAASRQYSNPIGQQFRFFIFGNPLQTVQGTHGLIVRNADGDIVFNSNRRNLRLVDVRSIQVEAGANFDVTSYPDRQYAVSTFNVTERVDGLRHRYSDGMAYMIERYSWSFARQLATGFHWQDAFIHHYHNPEEYWWQDLPASYSDWWYRDGLIALADVTGYV